MAKEQIYTTLKQFDEVEFPAHLHGRIMRTIYLRQFRTPLVIINSILLANFAMSTHHLWRIFQPHWADTRTVLAEAGAPAWSVWTALESAFRAMPALPLASVGVVAINVALLGVGVYLLWKLKSFLPAARAGTRTE